MVHRADATNALARFFEEVKKWDQSTFQVDNFNYPSRWPKDVKSPNGIGKISVASALINSHYTLEKLQKVCQKSTSPPIIPHLNVADSHTVWLYINRAEPKRSSDGFFLPQNKRAREKPPKPFPSSIAKFEKTMFPNALHEDKNFQILLRWSKLPFKKQVQNDEGYIDQIKRIIGISCLHQHLEVIVKAGFQLTWDKNLLSKITGHSVDIFRRHHGSFLLLFDSAHKKILKSCLNLIQGGFQKRVQYEGKTMRNCVKLKRLVDAEIQGILEKDPEAFVYDGPVGHMATILGDYLTEIREKKGKDS